MTANTKVKQANFSDVANQAFLKGFELAERGRANEAVNSYIVAAKLGSTDAQNGLATLLADHVSPKQPKLAVYWYKRAERAGSDIAAWNLAMQYAMSGSKRLYLYWLYRAKAKGDTEAINELCTRYWWRKHQTVKLNFQSGARQRGFKPVNRFRRRLWA